MVTSHVVMVLAEGGWGGRTVQEPSKTCANVTR